MPPNWFFVKRNRNLQTFAARDDSTVPLIAAIDIVMGTKKYTNRCIKKVDRFAENLIKQMEDHSQNIIYFHVILGVGVYRPKILNWKPVPASVCLIEAQKFE